MTGSIYEALNPNQEDATTQAGTKYLILLQQGSFPTTAECAG